MTHCFGGRKWAALLVAGSLAACAGSSIPPETIAAAQALRLLGAVEITHFSAAQGYAAPEELKRKQLLDPEWPRVSSQHYRIHCEVAVDKEKFVCYADALRAGDPWFRIDDSQRLRAETGRRPTEASSLFVLPKSGGGL